MEHVELAVALSAAALFVQSANLLSDHAPKVRELAGASPDDARVVHELRCGEVSSGILIMGAGAVVALLAGATWPLLLAGGALVLSIAASEIALRRQPGDDEPAAGDILPLRPVRLL